MYVAPEKPRDRLPRRSKLSGDALQRTATFMPLPALLAEFGVTLEQLEQVYPVPRAMWTEPNFFLPFSQLCRLLDAAARLTDCPHLGLLLGTRTDHLHLGPAGSWLFTAPTLRDAINGFIALQSSNTRAATNYLHDFEDDTFLGYGIYDCLTTGREQIYALALSVAHRMIQKLVQGRLEPLEVLFPFRPPKNVAPFERVFQAPVRFNAAACGLVLRKSVLDSPIGGSAEGDLEDWLQRASDIMPPAKHAWTARTRQILRPLLARERSVAPTVARLSGVSVRTLNRRLQAEGSSLKVLVDDMRLMMAEEYLLLTDLRVTEIGMLLGFEAEGSFYRGFKRWTGTTPEAWRSSPK